MSDEKKVLIVRSAPKSIRTRCLRLYPLLLPTTTIHVRGASTFQETGRDGQDEPIAAILNHKLPFGHGDASTTGKPSPDTLRHDSSPVKDHHKKSSWTVRGKDVMSTKRNGKRQPQLQVSRQERSMNKAKVPSTFKDEAYVRRTMHVPSPKDYPEARRELFTSPKSYLIRLTQGIASFNSNFTEQTKHMFRCDLTYDSAAHKISVDAQGRTKVSSPS